MEESRRPVRVGLVIYRDIEEDGSVWYVAVEPMTGAQAQGVTIEEAISRVKEEVSKMLASWCESELREAIEARIIEVEIASSAGEDYGI